MCWRSSGSIDLLHANDSRDPPGTGADRHANLGKGQIGTEVLSEMIKAAGPPVVVETPGGANGHPGGPRVRAQRVRPRRNLSLQTAWTNGSISGFYCGSYRRMGPISQAWRVPGYAETTSTASAYSIWRSASGRFGGSRWASCAIALIVERALARLVDADPAGWLRRVLPGRRRAARALRAARVPDVRGLGRDPRSMIAIAVALTGGPDCRDASPGSPFPWSR